MTIFYNHFELVPCAVCSVQMEVASSEIADRKQYDKGDVYVCYTCRSRWFWMLCTCGAVHTSFPQFHFSWCGRNKMDHSKEVIRRIKEYNHSEVI